MYFKSSKFILYSCVTSLTLLPTSLAFSDEVNLDALPAKHLSPIQLKPELTEINRKGPPLAHKPFALKDPNTGAGSEEGAKAIPREAQLTFPNGKKVQAGAYYDELNRFEQHVNQYGYSLREKGPAVIPYGGVKLNLSEFNSKRDEVVAKHDVSLVKPRVTLAVARAAHGAAAANVSNLKSGLTHLLNPILLPGIVKPVAKTFHDSKSWSNSFGWSNKFGAFLDNSIVLDGNADTTSAKGDASAGGFLFGQKLNIVRGTSSYTTPKDGNLVGDVAFYFLGYKLFSKDYNNENAYFYNNEWSKGLDENTTIHFALGPIPMSAKLGAQGDAKMDFRMGMLPLHANVDFVPGVDSKVYIQIGVDIVVGGAGGGSDLVLLDDTMDIVGRLQVQIDGKGPYFVSDIQGNNDMNTLAGRVYAYVFLYVPCWGIPPWEKKEWDLNLFQMAGIHANGALFNVEKKIYLF